MMPNTLVSPTVKSVVGKSVRVRARAGVGVRVRVRARVKVRGAVAAHQAALWALPPMAFCLGSGLGLGLELGLGLGKG